jgi:hypothetical protein
MNEIELASIKDKITNKTYAIYDYAFQLALRDIPWADWLSKPEYFRCGPEYLDTIDAWIKSSTLNSITGLGTFKVQHIINGTTQVFDEAYFKYSSRRLRVLRGEYAYHSRIVPSRVFIEDEPLQRNDWIIVSVPFCTTGSIPDNFTEILDDAYIKGIPVILDCAYFGTCTGITLDVSHPAIESVSFSLSKGLGLGDVRSGIRYSNIHDTLPIAQHNAYNHTVLCAAKIGIWMMTKFTPDFIPLKYRKSQLAMCERLNIVPTQCTHLALGHRHEWGINYSVDDKYTRLGIREAVKDFFKQTKHEQF